MARIFKLFGPEYLFTKFTSPLPSDSNGRPFMAYSKLFFRKQLDGRGEGEDRPEVNSLFQRGTNTNILFIQIKGPLEDIIQEIYGSAIGFSLCRSFGPYNIFLVTDRSIYCHMTLSAMNYLLYICQFCFPLVTTLLNIIIAVVKPY